VEQTTKES